MSNLVRTYSLSVDTVKEIEALAIAKRWDLSTVIEVSVDDLFKRELSQPNPSIVVGDAIQAGRVLDALNEPEVPEHLKAAIDNLEVVKG